MDYNLYLVAIAVCVTTKEICIQTGTQAILKKNVSLENGVGVQPLIVFYIAVCDIVGKEDTRT